MILQLNTEKRGVGSSRFLPLGIAIFWANFLSAPAHADFLDNLKIDEGAYAQVFRFGITKPNERRPQDAAAILSEADPGIYMSVGTERALIGASLAKNCTHLLMVDGSPTVVQFNRINVGLLTLAKSRSDYLYLRNEASPAEWKARAIASSKQLPKEIYDLLTNENSPADFRSRAEHLEKKPAGRFDREFRGANYLTEDGQFEKLSAMAKEGKIQVTLANLNDSDRLIQIVESIRRSGLKISVLDISNAFVGVNVDNGLGYMTPSKLQYLLNALRDVVVPSRSIFLTTQMHSPYPQQVESIAKGSRWDYFGFTFDTVLSPSASELSSIVRELSETQRDVLERDHPLPIHRRSLQIYRGEPLKSRSALKNNFPGISKCFQRLVNGLKNQHDYP